MAHRKRLTKSPNAFSSLPSGMSPPALRADQRTMAVLPPSSDALHPRGEIGEVRSRSLRGSLEPDLVARCPDGILMKTHQVRRVLLWQSRRGGHHVAQNTCRPCF